MRSSRSFEMKGNLYTPPAGVAERNMAKVRSILIPILCAGLIIAFCEHIRYHSNSLEAEDVSMEPPRSTACSLAASPLWDYSSVLDWCSPSQEPLDVWVPCEQLEKLQEDNNIVLVQTNCGYVDFAVNLWRAYERLGRNNVLFLAVDCQAYTILSQRIGPLHVAKPLSWPQRTMKGAQSYNSSDYRRFTVGRAMLMQYFVQRGYNVLWQDVDSVPIKDPFEFLPPRIPSLDLIITNDSANSRNPLDTQMCSCFVYVMANRFGSNWFLERWYKLTLLGAGLNQPSMNQALLDALNPSIFGTQEFVHMVLPMRYFPNGATMENFNSTAWWAHANWRVGKPAKYLFLKKLSLWGADDVACT